jgi:DNA-binding NarL/FixJ family response regulator
MRHCGPHELRILIADRPGPARSALSSTLSALDDIAVVGAEGSGREIGSAMRALHPDVVVIDDRLLGEWREPYDLGVQLVVVGVDDDPAFAARASQRRAVAWLPKECAGDQLVDVLDGIRASLTRRMPFVAAAPRGGRESAP